MQSNLRSRKFRGRNHLITLDSIEVSIFSAPPEHMGVTGQINPDPLAEKEAPYLFPYSAPETLNSLSKVQGSRRILPSILDSIHINTR